MYRRVLILILTVFSRPEFAAASEVNIFEYSARPEITNNFAEASFSCVLPAEKPRAILFLAGGTDSDARPWLQDPQWRALAQKEHLVLIAACLRGAGEPYVVASQGSGQALLDAVAAFAKESANPEIDHLPLILYGHSAGAQFAFNFACWKPELVRAIVGVKSGPLTPHPLPGAPPFRALFIVGERDLPGRVREVAKTFAAGRAQGAPWCLAYQPNAGHDTQGCRDLAEAFIAAVDSETSPQSGYAGMSALDANMKSAGATDVNQSWLPDAPFFQTWRGFTKGVALQSLLTLPEEPAGIPISWRPVTALAERLDVAQPHGSFEYLVSVPEDSAAITQATVRASSPAVKVTATRRSDREWIVAGECDLHDVPLGPFKCDVDVDLVTEIGAHERGQSTLFTQLTGPVAVRPTSLYYGVIPRETTVDFQLEIRPTADQVIRSCEATSSDPKFVSVTVAPSKTPGGYAAKCTIQSGSWVGARNGRLTFRVEADRSYDINVPFYGFIKK